MTVYLKNIREEFYKNKNPKIAFGQKAYMKNKFEFLGITSPIRKEIQKPFLISKHLPPKDNLDKDLKALWQEQGREFQYFAQELFQKYKGQFEITDIVLMLSLIHI